MEYLKLKTMNAITKACLDVIINNAPKKRDKLRNLTYVNGEKFNTKSFNIAMIAVRETLNLKVNEYPARKYLTEKLVESKSRVTGVKDVLQKLNKEKEDLYPVGSAYPECQMRYIIIEDKVYNEEDNYEETIYRFYFAKRHTSHSELADEARKVYPKGHTVGGGFYARRSANGLTEVFGYFKSSPCSMEILLWGKSDTFGLNPSTLNKAIKDYYRDNDKMTVKISVL